MKILTPQKTQGPYPKATLYYFLDLIARDGISRVEVKNLIIGNYETSTGKKFIALKFRRPKARKNDSLVIRTGQSLVAFEGWNLPDFPSWVPSSLGPNIYTLAGSPIVREEWKETYETFINQGEFKGVRLIADFRNDKMEPPGYSLGFTGEEFFEKSPPSFLDYAVRLPDEIPKNAASTLTEGATVQITVDSYERSPEARRRCIQIYGYTCQACNENLGEKYPGIGDRYIHVHHKTPLSAIGAEYKVNPETDLIPVCPNCHAMIHRRSPPYTVEDIRSVLAGGEPPLSDDVPF